MSEPKTKNGKVILWACDSSKGHLVPTVMYHNLWWIIQEMLDVIPGRVRFYETGLYPSLRCDHISCCNDPDEILSAMENSEFDSCVVFPLEYTPIDATLKRKTLRFNGKNIYMGPTGLSWNRTASRLTEAAHRLGINLVIISIGVLNRPPAIQREVMPYLENIVPEMDIIITDQPYRLYLKTPKSEILYTESWANLLSRPFRKKIIFTLLSNLVYFFL